MSTRQTTVGELTAADLGKWVEFAGESGHLTMVSHHHSSSSTTIRLSHHAGEASHVAQSEPCTVIDRPNIPEPLNPAVRVRDRNGDIYARIGTGWASSESAVWSWADLDDPVVVES